MLLLEVVRETAEYPDGPPAQDPFEQAKVFSTVDWIMVGGPHGDGIVGFSPKTAETGSKLVGRFLPMYETYEVLSREIAVAVAGGEPDIGAVHEALDDLLTNSGAGWAAWWSSSIADHALQMNVSGGQPQYAAAVGWAIAEKLLPSWALDSLRSWFNQKPAKEKDGSQPATTRPNADQHPFTNNGHTPASYVSGIDGSTMWGCSECGIPRIGAGDFQWNEYPCFGTPCTICGRTSNESDLLEQEHGVKLHSGIQLRR